MQLDDVAVSQRMVAADLLAVKWPGHSVGESDIPVKSGGTGRKRPEWRRTLPANPAEVGRGVRGRRK